MKIPFGSWRPGAAFRCARSHAIVGGAAPATEGVVRSVVTIVGSRGNSCSGTLIAPDLVLSVAHCVGPGARLQDRRIRQRTGSRSCATSRRVAAHPGFDMQTMLAHRATADVACCNSRRRRPIRRAIGAPLDAARRRQSFHDRRYRRHRARRRQERRRRAIAPIWSRPVSPARCRSAWSIPPPAARARGSAPAPAIPAGRCSRSSKAGRS